MSLRFSPDEALERGFIDAATAKQIKAGAKRLSPTANTQSSPAPKMKSSTNDRDVGSYSSPQKILFDALCERLPGIPQWEVAGLIPDRKFRIDIFIPPCVAVELDGFAYHRDLNSFKKDRQRQNLLAASGFLVFRTYAKEVLDENQRHELVELIARTVEGKLHFTRSQ